MTCHLSQYLPPWRRQDTRCEPLDRVAGVQHEPGPTTPTVLLAEHAKVFRIVHSRPGSGLHFDRQKRTARLDDEVDFLPGGRPPVEHLRAIKADVPPGEQVVQYEILEMGADRLAETCQMERESCIGPIDFRSFDDAFRAIHRIGRQTYELIGGLEQIQPSMYRWLWQRHVAAELSLIQQLPQTEAYRSHEAAEIGERGDRRQLPKIALQIRLHVAGEPRRSRIVGMQIERGHRVS